MLRELAIAQIIADTSVDIRLAMDDDAIERYRGILDRLPPVMVFATPEGNLLADGFHRTEAARREGRATITAEVKKGTRSDALLYAATANANHGVPLSADERRGAVLRIRELDPAMSASKMANLLGVSEHTVSRVLRVDMVHQATRSAGTLGPSHYEDIYKAPKPLWRSLVRAAATQAWSRTALRAAIADLTDAAVPETVKARVLRGTVAPGTWTPEGPVTASVTGTAAAKEERRFAQRVRDAHDSLDQALDVMVDLRRLWETEPPEMFFSERDGADVTEMRARIDEALGVLAQVRKAALGRDSVRIVR